MFDEIKNNFQIRKSDFAISSFILFFSKTNLIKILFLICFFCLFYSIIVSWSIFNNFIFLIISYPVFVIFSLKLEQKNIIKIFLSLTITIITFTLIIKWFNISDLFTTIFFSLAYSLFIRKQKNINEERIKISISNISFSWYFIFSLLTSLVYSTNLILHYNTDKLSCEDLNIQSQKTVNLITAPFRFSIEKITKFKDNIWYVFEKNIWELIWDIPKNNTNTNNIKNWLIWRFDNIKNNTVNKIIEDKNILNSWICNLITNLLIKTYSKNEIQAWAFVLILLATIPFFTVIWIIWWVITYIIIRFLILINFFTIKTKKIDIDTIV